MVISLAPNMILRSKNLPFAGSKWPRAPKMMPVSAQNMMSHSTKMTFLSKGIRVLRCQADIRLDKNGVFVGRYTFPGAFERRACLLSRIRVHRPSKFLRIHFSVRDHIAGQLQLSARDHILSRGKDHFERGITC